MTDKKVEFPPMETMLADLAKVPGLDSFWEMMTMALHVKPGFYTPGEQAIIESVTQSEAE
jgi:hypothetical protein